MVGITERNQQKQELVDAGFSLRYIDEWIPKTTLHRHKASYNVTGSVSEDVGSTVKGVPGSPDYVLRKAKIGLFPWAPGESCECQWCAEAATGRSVERVVSEVVEIQDARSRPTSVSCPVCDYVSEGASLAGARSKLRAHAKGH